MTINDPMSSQNQYEKDVFSIKTARLASNAAIAKKDVAGVSKYWLPDFVQIAGDGSYTKGKKRITEEWKYMFSNSSPLFERLPEEIIISESGDRAWEKGTWNYKNETHHGSYSAMWQKVNEQWLTRCELYVSLN